MEYLPTWKPYKSTIHVGKYTSPMDGNGMGVDEAIFYKTHKKVILNRTKKGIDDW